MALIAWLLIGSVAGLLARAVAGARPAGCIATVATGIAGALLGGFLSTLLGFGGLLGGFDLRNLAVATLGSVVLLLGLRLLRGR